MKMRTYQSEGRVWPKVHPLQHGPSIRQRLMVLAQQLGCEGCIFWDQIESTNPDVGLCKCTGPRLPRSRIDRDSPALVGNFPPMMRWDWCGEWQPAPLKEGTA